MPSSAPPNEIVLAADEVTKHVNGNARSRTPRKASKTANGTGETKVKSKPAHKVDKSGHFEFGGSIGTAAMMIFFPILMYYLWICTTFYGGSLFLKKSSETWLAFIDRMVAHVTKALHPYLYF